jgi:ribonuclease HI
MYHWYHSSGRTKISYCTNTTQLKTKKSVAKKFYVVWQGRNTGIYDSWEDCKTQVENYQGAKYKSFTHRAEAEAAFQQAPYQKVTLAQRLATLPAHLPKPIFPSIAVDAACSGNPGDLEYRGVDTATGKELFRQGVFKEGTNNVGEFLALVHGLAYLKNNGSDYPLYTDSIAAMAWVQQKKAKTELTPTAQNKQLFELIARATNWLENNHYVTKILKWETEIWGEIPADFGRK